MPDPNENRWPTYVLDVLTDRADDAFGWYETSTPSEMVEEVGRCAELAVARLSDNEAWALLCAYPGLRDYGTDCGAFGAEFARQAIESAIASRLWRKWAEQSDRHADEAFNYCTTIDREIIASWPPNKETEHRAQP